MPSPRYKSKERTPSSTPYSSLYRLLRSPLLPSYLLLFLLLLGLTLVHLMPPFHRLFTLSNPSLQFPHADPERVPVTLCLLLSAALPALLITLTSLTLPLPTNNPKPRFLTNSLLSLTLTILLTTFLTDLIKNTYGRPRPDLIARCKPAPGTPVDQLVDFTVCTETRHHVLHDGWRSFPSGHSSFAFAGLGFLSLWVGKFVGRRWWLVVGGWPWVVAVWIAGSRTRDYRHDSMDVTVGSVLGLCGAVWGADWLRGLEEAAEGEEGGDNMRRRERDEEEGFERLEMVGMRG